MSSSNIWMLAVGILATLITAVLATSARRTIAIGTLLALIPFQVVQTRYASSSVLMAYAISGVLLLAGGLKIRMLPAIALILLTYFASLTQAGSHLTMHVIEIFQFGSCLVVFLLAYNYARLVKAERAIMDLLLGINVAVVVYCVLQFTAGAGKAFVPFGIEQLAFNVNRDPSDPRLVGPFGLPGTTAGYLALMSMLCFVDLVLSSGRRRMFVQALIVANMIGIMATGNRATFLVLLASFPVLLLVFRNELGARRVLQYMVVGVTILAVISTIVVAHTGLSNIVRRLDTVTETEEGMPATRAGTWPLAIEKIKRDPWFGEGPHFFRLEDAEMLGVLRTQFEELGEIVTAYDPYPHSLYLYMLRTVGIFGLLAMLGFFLQVWREMQLGLRRGGSTDYSRAIMRVAIVLIPAFLVTQITLEFNRTGSMDYAQFIFALMGLFVGVRDRKMQTQPAPTIHRAAVIESAKV